MEELLSSIKPLSFSRNQEVTGKVISKTNKEVILDLGGKSDGVIVAKELPKDTFTSLKIGDELSAYVINENEYGQLILSSSKAKPTIQNRSSRNIDWSKFIQAKNQKTKLVGKVMEVNKGGLIVEIDGIRGFLPSSLIGYDLINQADQEGLLNKETAIFVSEIDPENNRLIFSQKEELSKQLLKNLHKLSSNQKITGQILAILPFALIVRLEEGINGVVFSSEGSWDSRELANIFKVESKIEVKVLSIEEDLGRVNLSIKQLQKNPFDEVAEKFQADDVVKATVTEVSDQGISFELADGIAGFMDSSKKEAGVDFQIGQSVQVLVDSVDKRRQRVNLAPFITTTKGLIYK